MVDKGFNQMEPARTWEERYQAGNPGWERGHLNAALIHWLDSGELTPPARVLVPGCGRSPEALYLAQQGFAITGIDFATSAITSQEQALAGLNPKPEAIFVQIDMFEFYLDRPVDVIYEQTCLCALNPHIRSRYETKKYQWLKPGGKLLALLMQTGKWGGPPYDCPVDAMHTVFPEERWQWSTREPSAVDHTNDKVELGYVLSRK